MAAALNDFVQGLLMLFGIVAVIGAVLSASMSTLSSLVLTSSSTITLDFLLPLSGKKVSEKKKLLIMRGFIVVFIIISAAIAISQVKNKNIFIAQMMGVSWGALAGGLVLVPLAGLFTRSTLPKNTGEIFSCYEENKTVGITDNLGK